MAEGLSPQYDPRTVERKWYAFWEENQFFHADPASDKPPYTIVIPPPNITGILHLGHVLNNTVQDVLVRFRRMQALKRSGCPVRIMRALPRRSWWKECSPKKASKGQH